MFSFLCQAVTNYVCLCFSDCESREVLTLLCQGKTWAQIYAYSVWHTGTLYTPLPYTHLSSFSTFKACNPLKLYYLCDLFFQFEMFCVFTAWSLSVLLSVYLSFPYLAFYCSDLLFPLATTVHLAHFFFSSLCWTLLPRQTAAGVVLQQTV